jgi:hypothetical protein
MHHPHLRRSQRYRAATHHTWLSGHGVRFGRGEGRIYEPSVWRPRWVRSSWLSAACRLGRATDRQCFPIGSVNLDGPGPPGGGKGLVDELLRKVRTLASVAYPLACMLRGKASPFICPEIRRIRNDFGSDCHPSGGRHTSKRD